MVRNRTGLHKDVSSIFDGVPIPKSERAPQIPPNQDQNTFASDYTTPKPELSPPMPPVEKTQQPSQPAPKPKASKRRITVSAGSAKQYFDWQKILNLAKDKLFPPDADEDAKKQKLMIAAVSFLAVIFLFVLIKVFTGSPDEAKASVATEGPSGKKDSVQINWDRPDQYPVTIRDPMRIGSVAASQTDVGRPVVKGIVHSNDKATAVIGTEIVRTGDMIGGAKIIKINRDSVEFEMEGKRWTQSVQQ